MTFKAAMIDPRFITLSEGNKKLKSTDLVKFLIFNIPAVITCPYATAHCKQFCYAVKAEKVYPDVLPARLAKLAASQQNDFVDRMIFTIKAYAARPGYMKAKKIVVRIHESGDFYNMKYLYKWYQIAEAFKNDKRVVFMAYTKSVRFIDALHEAGHDIPKNMIVRYSVWDDTKADEIEIAKKHGLPIYTAVDRFDKSIPSQCRCRCKDCATCKKCWSKTKQLICEIH